MNIINIASLLGIPVYLVKQCHPAANLVFITYDLMLLMKLVSYAHTMRTTKDLIDQVKEVNGKSTPLKEFFKDSEIT